VFGRAIALSLARYVNTTGSDEHTDCLRCPAGRFSDEVMAMVVTVTVVGGEYISEERWCRSGGGEVVLMTEETVKTWAI